MNNLKYIIVHPDYNPNWLSAILFNSLIEHSSMVPDGFTAVSAGFCNIQNNHTPELIINCWGESVSLNLYSNPQGDGKVIADTLSNCLNFYF